MTLLTQIVSANNATIGEAKQIMVPSAYNQPNLVPSNTVTDSFGGVWVRSGLLYKQATYPDLFAKIGFVSATIGITKTIDWTVAGVNATDQAIYQTVKAIAYSPQDDVYLIGGANTVAVFANSSMQTFTYNRITTNNFITGAAFGGINGGQRFILTMNNNSYAINPTNLTTTAISLAANGVVAANQNTFIMWSNTSGTLRRSTDSGASFTAPASNTQGVLDVVWGNVGGANGTYILTPNPAATNGFSAAAWTEMSTDGVSWTGLQTQTANNKQINKFALGTANIYVVAFSEANSFANTVQAEIHTSTDGRYWQYRGALPITTSLYGVGGPRITAVSNGANTVIASSDWFYTSVFQGFSAFYYYGCYDQPFDAPHLGHGNRFVCGQLVGGFTSTYTYSTPSPYNKIYSSNASMTNTVSSNIYVSVGACVPAHNTQIIMALGYGYANNATYYVYGTNNGNVATSLDAVTWTDRNPSLASGVPIRHIVYGTANSTNTFMFLANNGNVYTTQNMVTYTARTTAHNGAFGWSSGAFGNANGTLMYVIGGNTGNVLISNDGVQFSGTNTLTQLNGVAFGNNRFVAVSNASLVKYSFDGVFWSNTGAIAGAAADIYSVASDGTKFVYAGQSGRTGYLFDVTGAWTNGTITTTNSHFTVTYGGGTWVMGGTGGSLFTSTDGITWTYRTSGTQNTILTTMYANNTYFYGGDNVLATSTDAISWTVRNANSNNYIRISALAYDNVAKIYVYGAQGFYGRSTDGITWTRTYAGSLANDATNVASTILTNQINEIVPANISGNIVLVSIGTSGFVETSNNASNTWVVQNTKTNADFTSMAFGNNRFLAVGSRGTARISPNGVIWSGHASNANVFSIAYYQNTVNSFILVGAALNGNTSNSNTLINSISNTGNAIIDTTGNANISYLLETSNDAIYWTTRQWKTPMPPGFAVGGNSIAAIMEVPHYTGNNFNASTGNTVSNTSNLFLLADTTNPTLKYTMNSSGRISVSNNLTTWSGVGLTSSASNTGIGNTAANLSPSISFANGLFFATGNSGIYATSNDGIYWTTSNLYQQILNTYGTTYNSGAALSKFRYHAASDTYIVTGSLYNYTSKDLVNWTIRPVFTLADTTGPLAIGGIGTGSITYANNANNYVAATYDVSTDFLVPSMSGGASASGTYAPTMTWYVKAK